MEQKITAIVAHIAATHREMSRILQAKRQVAAQMSAVTREIPDSHPQFEGVEALQEQSLQLTRGVTAYLNSLADLVDAIAQQTEVVMKEMNGSDAEE
ncbi:nucleoside-diphosphate sugar epimerase [Paenibacillus athensensis]|uniref:Nucleoside-diphosphate sugar epimerase n=1 Tax=Paenibacillus athensensis TaxID=1967502 RepID=A0A4Y8PU43_9BACL|nr:nucleoside-diphosphate sugar epimerase [Paenibacillus athensensis]MCD1258100.1 nucleoside-diphosphate sugar epimerase [Paenibacillus athensensis]